MDAIRSCVAGNLTLVKTVYGYRKQEEELNRLLERFCAKREGTSAVLIGPHGSGKTTVLNKCLDSLLASHSTVSIVRLNGFIHTDDRLSLAEIANQLHSDLDTAAPNVSYFEAMKVIMDMMQGMYSVHKGQSLCTDSVQEKETVSENKRSTVSVIFVVEEFDLFAAHHNQSLLYTLLDLTQNSSDFLPVCVIGVSCRPDMIDLLEKRVRSRLSPMHIKLNNQWELEEYVSWAEDLLLCSPDLAKPRTSKKHVHKWNRDVKTWVNSSQGRGFLQEKFRISKSIGFLKNNLLLLIAQMSDQSVLTDLFSEGENTDNQLRMSLAGDFGKDILQDLTLLELCICIAIKHLCIEDHADTFNLEMVHLEFRKFQNKKTTMLKCSKAMLLKAFEHLESMELIRPATETYGNKHLQKSFRLMNAQFDLKLLDDIFESKEAKFPAPVKNWYSHRL